MNSQKQSSNKASIQSFYDDEFQKIRKLDDISNEILLESLDIESNRKMVFRSGESAGLSGSFFFFSHDNKFIIKTLSSSDKKKLIEIMEGDYCSYLMQNKNSLLARIYGMYNIKK